MEEKVGDHGDGSDTGVIVSGPGNSIKELTPGFSPRNS